MNIQADIPEDINSELKILKIKKNYRTLEEVLIFVLQEYFKNKKLHG